MATHYVDPTAGDTVAALTVSGGDVIAIRCGTTLREQINGAQIQANDITITQYGSGSNPIISGSDLVTGWLQDAPNGVWYKSLGSNIGGNVREDGRPMPMVAWTTNIATTAPNIATGGFSFDPVGFIVYIKPSSGTPADHAYEVSSRLYCINNGGSYSGLIVEGVDIAGASRHGIVLANRNGFVYRGGRIEFCGGYYETSISVRLGNGIELAEGCNDALVEDSIFNEIFDTGGTSQLYKTSAASIARHIWRRNAFSRCRLAGVEVSTQTANQTISAVDIYGNTFSDMTGGWGGALSTNAGVNLTNNGGATSTLSNIRIRNNLMPDCENYAVLLNGAARQQNIAVHGNVIDGVGLRGVRTTGPALIDSNIIRRQTYGVEVVGAAAPTVTAVHNVLIGNERALRGDAAGATLIARNNIIRDNTFSYSHSGAGTTFTASNNNVNGNGASPSYSSTNDITTAPELLVDYKLPPGSALLGAGTHLGYTRDIERKQRPNPPSIGAYDRATMRNAS